MKWKMIARMTHIVTHMTIFYGICWFDIFVRVFLSECFESLVFLEFRAHSWTQFPYFCYSLRLSAILHCRLPLSFSLSRSLTFSRLPLTTVSNDNIKHSSRLIILGEQANRAKQNIYHSWQTTHLLLIKIYWIPICVAPSKIEKQQNNSHPVLGSRKTQFDENTFYLSHAKSFDAAFISHRLFEIASLFLFLFFFIVFLCEVKKVAQDMRQVITFSFHLIFLGVFCVAVS